ncbi:MAG: cysteine desulfurase family protein [Candidatus Woesearchaeota archaeon]
MKAYLDNGATTKVDPEVAKAVVKYMTEEFGNAASLHSFGEKAGKALEDARQTLAKALNADPEEIVFTSGGTESDNLAIKGVAYLNKGNHIITSKIEHHAVLNTCEELEKEGFSVTYLGVDSEGFVRPEQLEKSITDKTILVTIMHANNEIGTILPIEEYSRICKKHNVLFHTDAVQSFTKVPIDVKKMDIDMLSATAHKIHGPKGIGILYVRKGVKLHRLMDGGSHEFKLRAGTQNVAGAAGFAKAVEIIKKEDIDGMTKLRDRLISELLKIDCTRLNGSTNRLCNNANITFEFIEGEAMLMMLNDKGIAVSTGSACTSKSLAPSHVLTAIGLSPELCHGSIRFTLSKYTTQEEIDYTIKAVKDVVAKLREYSPLVKK